LFERWPLHPADAAAAYRVGTLKEWNMPNPSMWKVFLASFLTTLALLVLTHAAVEAEGREESPQAGNALASIPASRLAQQ